jgi:hypothetical protein
MVIPNHPKEILVCFLKRRSEGRNGEGYFKLKGINPSLQKPKSKIIINL